MNGSRLIAGCFWFIFGSRYAESTRSKFGVSAYSWINTVVNFCLVWNKSIMAILPGFQFWSNLLHNTVITAFVVLCYIKIQGNFHNTSKTVSPISDSILGSKFWLVSKKLQHWNRVSGLNAFASDYSQVPGLKIMACQWTLPGQDYYLSVIINFC